MGRIVLTTGANSGIGLATVLELARRGFRSIGTVVDQVVPTTVKDWMSRMALGL